MSSSASEQASSSPPPVGIGTSPPVTIHPTPSYPLVPEPHFLPPPVRISPPSSSSSSSAGTPAPAPIPADLFASWRALMTSLGQTVPYHLNRAVTIARLLRRGS